VKIKNDWNRLLKSGPFNINNRIIIMQIMVRTRGLGRALRRTIGKVLGRRDESDDDVPQRRRPTTSARR